MAEAKTDEQALNEFFKNMAEVSGESKKWEDYVDNVVSFWIRLASRTLQSVPGKPVVVKVYGSVAEGLRCCLPHDVGDVDLMIFSTAAETAITPEMLRDIDGKPGFVRVYGTDHPVLSKFRKEGSDFVSTETLRKAHPEIFGLMSDFLEFAPKLGEAFSGLVSDEVAVQFMGSANGPAVTLDFASSLGTMTEQEERLRDQSCYQNSPAALETLAAFLCETRGVPYAKEHAELLRAYLAHCTEQVRHVAMDGGSIISEYPRLVGEFLSGPKIRELIQVREQLERDLAETGSAETESAGNENRLSPESQQLESDSLESGSVAAGCSGTVGAHRSEHPVDLTASSASGSGENKMSTDPKSEGRIGDESFQPEPEAQDDGGGPQNKSDLATLAKDPFVAHLFGFSDAKQEDSGRRYLTEVASHARTGGADFVPAFLGRGWPRVAGEWRSRRRKWPSPDVIDEVLRSGFHVVAKTPKPDGNAEVDFRLSFSHAEYLLSQQLTAVQKDCYRCLKLFHRAFLLTEQHVLLSYHLKNVLLWTAEETGLELWSEENRASCVLLLLGKLQEALASGQLPHYFVRSCNLLENAASEWPFQLGMLAEKVEDIRRDPTCFKWEMVWKDTEPCAGPTPCEREGKRTDDSAALPSPTPPVTSERVAAPDALKSAAASSTPPDAPRPAAPPGYRPPPPQPQHLSYHDFQDLYVDTAAEIAGLVLSGADVPTDDSVLKELEEDMRAMWRKHPELTPQGFVKMFKSTTTMAYAKFQLESADRDLMQRILSALRGWGKLFRHCCDNDLVTPGDEEANAEKLLDPQSGFDFSQVLPAGLGMGLVRDLLNFWDPASNASNAASDAVPEDIPLD